MGTKAETPIERVGVPWDSKWRSIPYFENYYINQYGQIFNMRTLRLQAQYINNKGLRAVRLWRNGHRIAKSVGKLLRDVWGISL
jgi:hypothetical protein